MTSTSHPYLHYRPSGVEWLEDVPEDWEVVQLGRIGTFSKGSGGTKDDEVPEGIPCVRYGDLYTTHRSFINQTRTYVPPAKARAYTPIHKGDVLFPTSGETIEEIGKSAVNLMNSQVLCGGDLIVFRPNIQMEPKYAGYALDCHAAQTQKSRMGRGITIMHIYGSQLKYLYLSLPPISEQRAIVRYLDYVDRRIRRYVSAKRKLIALLEEEKQAVINQAATRGLDTNVRLKPSGVEWLGDVPEHWEVRRLKTLGRIRYGLGQPPRESVDGLPLIRATNVERGRIVDRSLIRVDPVDVPATRDALLRRHEIIVVRSGAYTADSAIIPTAYDGAVAGYDLVVTATGCMAQFMAWALLSTYLRDDQLITASSRAAQPHLNAEELGASMLLVPPIYEQRAIVEHLDKATNDIDAAIARARRQVELVEEYRTRLIADVVTGKLDVRDAAAQLPDEAEGDVPRGEGGQQQNGLVEGIYDTEEHTQELGIESEVTR